MTREEKIVLLVDELEDIRCSNFDAGTDEDKTLREVVRVIKTLEQEPCEDAVSRQAVLELVANYDLSMGQVVKCIHALPPVTPQQNLGHCKDCKYFEYDSVAKVNEVPLIVAHEICNKWGNGCKTSENGYCFMFESQKGSNTV